MALWLVGCMGTIYKVEKGARARDSLSNKWPYKRDFIAGRRHLWSPGELVVERYVDTMHGHNRFRIDVTLSSNGEDGAKVVQKIWSKARI